MGDRMTDLHGEKQFFSNLSGQFPKNDFIELDSLFIPKKASNKLNRFHNDSIWFSRLKKSDKNSIYFFGLNEEISSNNLSPSLILRYDSTPNKSTIRFSKNNNVLLLIKVSKNSIFFKILIKRFKISYATKNKESNIYYLDIGNYKSRELIDNIKFLLYSFEFKLDLNKKEIMIKNIKKDFMDFNKVKHKSINFDDYSFLNELDGLILNCLLYFNSIPVFYNNKKYKIICLCYNSSPEKLKEMIQDISDKIKLLDILSNSQLNLMLNMNNITSHSSREKNYQVILKDLSLSDIKRDSDLLLNLSNPMFSIIKKEISSSNLSGADLRYSITDLVDKFYLLSDLDENFLMIILVSKDLDVSKSKKYMITSIISNFSLDELNSLINKISDINFNNYLFLKKVEDYILDILLSSKNLRVYDNKKLKIASLSLNFSIDEIKTKMDNIIHSKELLDCLSVLELDLMLNSRKLKYFNNRERDTQMIIEKFSPFEINNNVELLKSFNNIPNPILNEFLYSNLSEDDLKFLSVNLEDKFYLLSDLDENFLMIILVSKDLDVSKSKKYMITRIIFNFSLDELNSLINKISDINFNNYLFLKKVEDYILDILLSSKNLRMYHDEKLKIASLSLNFTIDEIKTMINNIIHSKELLGSLSVLQLDLMLNTKKLKYSNNREQDTQLIIEKFSSSEIKNNVELLNSLNTIPNPILNEFLYLNLSEDDLNVLSTNLIDKFILLKNLNEGPLKSILLSKYGDESESKDILIAKILSKFSLKELKSTINKTNKEINHSKKLLGSLSVLQLDLMLNTKRLKYSNNREQDTQLIIEKFSSSEIKNNVELLKSFNNIPNHILNEFLYLNLSETNLKYSITDLMDKFEYLKNLNEDSLRYILFSRNMSASGSKDLIIAKLLSRFSLDELISTVNEKKNKIYENGEHNRSRNYGDMYKYFR